MKIFRLLCIAVLGFLLFFSCENQNEEDLFGITVCDTTNVTYSNFIVPFLENNCFSCHSQSTAIGRPVLEGYANLKVVADDGRFRSVINHEPGFPQMPQNILPNKLPECQLKKVDVWINQGALEN